MKMIRTIINGNLSLMWVNKQNWQIMLTNININVSYKTNDTTEEFLAYKQEECIDKYNENGTYTLKYLDCGKRYLGQRGRPFKVRFKKISSVL